MRNFRFAFVCILFAASSAAQAVDYGVDLFGRSYHGTMPTGARRHVNEANLGFGVHATHYMGKHAFVVEIGTYKNSAYDQTYWLGGQYRYRLFEHLELGIMRRHWKTAHDTYQDVSNFPLISLPVTDKLRVQLMVFKPFNGAVASLSLDL